MRFALCAKSAHASWKVTLDFCSGFAFILCPLTFVVLPSTFGCDLAFGEEGVGLLRFFIALLEGRLLCLNL